MTDSRVDSVSLFHCTYYHTIIHTNVSYKGTYIHTYQIHLISSFLHYTQKILTRNQLLACTVYRPDPGTGTRSPWLSIEAEQRLQWCWSDLLHWATCILSYSHGGYCLVSSSNTQNRNCIGSEGTATTITITIITMAKIRFAMISSSFKKITQMATSTATATTTGLPM